jgi:hypothetical protein
MNSGVDKSRPQIVPLEPRPIRSGKPGFQILDKWLASPRLVPSVKPAFQFGREFGWWSHGKGIILDGIFTPRESMPHPLHPARALCLARGAGRSKESFSRESPRKSIFFYQPHVWGVVQ